MAPHSEMSPPVSVVISVYNGEKYLARCLDSAVGQTYGNIEIVVVNDGSTDSTGVILKEYSDRYPAIKVIGQSNMGLEMARKTGVANASGKYVQYLDADDTFCSEDTVACLVKLAEEHQADMVISPFVLCYEDGREISYMAGEGLVQGGDYIRDMLSGKGYYAIWAKFHKRSLYDDSIERIGVGVGEDAVLSVQLLSRSGNVYLSRTPVIDYYIYASSMSHDVTDRTYNDFMKYTAWLERYVTENIDCDLSRELVFYRTRNIMTRVYWRKEDEGREMPAVLENVKRYPEIMEVLPRREQKIIRAFRLSQLAGRIQLAYYGRK